MRGVTSRHGLTSGMQKFQLTRLMRGVTCERARGGVQHGQFQLTRLMRGVTLPDSMNARFLEISTHTPHARRDRRFPSEFSPH